MVRFFQGKGRPLVRPADWIGPGKTPLFFEAGKVTVRVEHPGLGRVERTAEIEPGEVCELEIGRAAFGAGAAEGAVRVSGTVCGADGRPLAGAELSLEPEAGGRRGKVLRTRTDGSGRYTLEGVAPGLWRARCVFAPEGGAGSVHGPAKGGVPAAPVCSVGFRHLRVPECAAGAFTLALDLPGYAVGGLGVGEGPRRMRAVLEALDAQLPANKPRYLMGVGEPADMLAAVACGVDLFDCVLPTRNARNAQAFTWTGRLRLRNAEHARDDRAVEEGCPCYTCRNFSRAAIRHYFQAQEMLGPILLTIHNLTFFARFTAAIRQAIAGGQFQQRSRQWLAQMYPRP